MINFACVLFLQKNTCIDFETGKVEKQYFLMLVKQERMHTSRGKSTAFPLLRFLHSTESRFPFSGPGKCGRGSILLGDLLGTVLFLVVSYILFLSYWFPDSVLQTWLYCGRPSQDVFFRCVAFFAWNFGHFLSDVPLNKSNESRVSTFLKVHLSCKHRMVTAGARSDTFQE